MKVLDRNINAWQTGIILFVLLFANKILLLPSLLFDGAKLEAVFVPVILFLLEMGVLFLFYRLKTHFPNESFAEVLRSHFGKGVQIAVYLLFVLFFICKAILLYDVTYIFFRNLIYKDYNNFLFLFCIIPIINHLAICGVRVIGRTAQLFFPLIVIIIIFCIVVGFFGIDSKILLFQGTFAAVAKTSLRHISSFGDIIFVFLIMDRVKVKKGQWKIIFTLAGAASIFIIAITIIFILSYTYTTFLHPYALFEIMSYVKEYGGLGRIDIISMVVIIIFTYFHLAIYLKAFMLASQEVLPKLNKIYPLLMFNLVFLIVINLFILNLEQAVVYGEKVLPYLAILPFAVLPILMIVLFVLRKFKKRGEVKNE